MNTYQIWFLSILFFVIVGIPSLCLVFCNLKAWYKERIKKKKIAAVIEPAFAKLYENTNAPKLIRQLVVGDTIYIVPLCELNNILSDPNRAKDLSIKDYLHEHVFPANITNVFIEHGAVYNFRLKTVFGKKGSIIISKKRDDTVDEINLYGMGVDEFVCSASLECLLTHLQEVAKRGMKNVVEYWDQAYSTHNNETII